MMTKYKVDDIVKVRKDLIVGNRYGKDIFVKDMMYMLGKGVTISKIIAIGEYRIKEDNDSYYWTDEMFESWPNSDINKEDYPLVFEKDWQ